MQKKDLTLNYYNGIAPGYKKLYHQEQIKKISLILEELPIFGKMLDLGSGDGVLNQFLNKNIQLISFDLSKELLKLNPNIEENKICGNAEKLPFKNNQFDCVCSFSVFQDITNKPKAIREIYRILKNESLFFLSFVKLNKDTVNILTTQIHKYFTIIKKLEEEKDLIFILKKSII